MNNLEFYKTVDVGSDMDSLHNISRRRTMTPETHPEPRHGTELAAHDTDTALLDIASAPFTWRTLTAIANTEFVPKAYRGKPESMLAAVLYGRESGLGPMTSLQMVDMIDGKPSMSAELMVSLVRRAGHSLTATELSPTSCTVKGQRVDSGDAMTFTFTIEDAAHAGLTDKKGGAWTKYPAAMLWARAVAQLIRMLFPDVLISMHNYTADELGVEVAEPGGPADLHDAVVEANVDMALEDRVDG